jgi:hypothetical protein
MPSERHLHRLREIRDQQRKARSLLAERDHLIRESLKDGHSQTQVAIASGLSQSRVQEIATGDR